MQWALVIKDTETGKTRLMLNKDRGTRIDLDRFERHVAPCEVVGEGLNFGAHEFTRECICRPRIEKDGYDYEFVIHEDRKPN